MNGPFYGLNPSHGLHKLKDHWGQKGHLAEQCLSLAQDLAMAIEKTTPPLRTQPYNLQREENTQIHASQVERLWEQAIWQRWRPPNEECVLGGWGSIVTYQVPLFDNQKKSGWGYIDLLGIDPDGTLVVIELKKEPRINPAGNVENSETPLRMLLEAAAYAIALRKNWGIFRLELNKHLVKLTPDIVSKLPDKLHRIRLVGMAPAEYWQQWLPVTPKGMTVDPAAWDAFRKLLRALDAVELPTTFVSLVGDPDRPRSLRARWLKEFPLG